MHLILILILMNYNIEVNIEINESLLHYNENRYTLSDTVANGRQTRETTKSDAQIPLDS